MIRLLFLSILSLFFTDNPGDKDRFEPIEKTFSINWKAKIGNASFRSNVVFTETDLMIGSNGKYFRDYYLGDETSGIYKLNRQSGKINALYGNDQVIGDMDVNGILLYKNNLYFGNDNDEFMCLNASGKTIWSVLTSGDIEHEAVMININGKPAIVYASETGEVRALNPDNGQTFWSFYIPDFKGWKPDNNRATFKIQSFFYNTTSFLTKPLIADLNKDGNNDLIYKELYGSVYAIDGKSGKMIWNIKIDEGGEVYDLLELLPKPEGEWIMVGCKTEYIDEENQLLKISLISNNGKVKEIHRLKEKTNDCGLNMAITKDNEILFTNKNSLFRIKNSKEIETIDIGIKYESDATWYINKNRTRNSYESLVCKTTFPYKNYKNCIIVLNQNDEAHYQNGFIEIISLDENKVVDVFELPGQSEMEPVIKDINKDGMLDLLISCKYDGYLYCYDLKIPVSSISSN
jgi:hypothetical protein